MARTKNGTARSSTRGSIIDRLRKRIANRNDFAPDASTPAPQGWLSRHINAWWNRLIGAVFSGRVAEQTERYASHRTTRDYVCNTLGLIAWGTLFPVLSIVTTQLAGAELAGMFSLAMVVGQLLLFLANYGVRTFQVSDVDEMEAFLDYQISRVVTCVAMMLVGIIFIRVRGYAEPMASICLWVFAFRMVDGLADVYEGRLQQKDKLYLAGISQFVRCLAGMIVFSAVLLVTRNVVWACFGMALAAIASFVVLTLPLTLFETENSYPWSMRGVKEIFVQCFPLFCGLFLYNVIEALPKIAMEGVLSYEDQLCYNAMFFPSQIILMLAGFVYKPQLVRLANIWEDPDPEQRKRFDLLIILFVAFIALVTGVTALIMAWIGIPAMSFLYGIDFEPYRPLALVLVASGGICAAIDFIYQIIAVLREQQGVAKLYLISIAFSVPIILLLINFAQLAGAVVGTLVIMSILLVLLIMEYSSIRGRLRRW